MAPLEPKPYQLYKPGELVARDVGAAGAAGTGAGAGALGGALNPGNPFMPQQAAPPTPGAFELPPHAPHPHAGGLAAAGMDGSAAGMEFLNAGAPPTGGNPFTPTIDLLQARLQESLVRMRSEDA